VPLNKEADRTPSHYCSITLEHPEMLYHVQRDPG